MFVKVKIKEILTKSLVLNQMLRLAYVEAKDHSWEPALLPSSYWGW